MSDLKSLLNEQEIGPNEFLKNENEKKILFMEKLTIFLSGIGKGIDKIPVVNYVEIDLFKFYQIVDEIGGYNCVNPWTEIWKKLPNYDSGATDASSRLKNIYERYLLDYEYHVNPDRKKDLNKLKIKKTQTKKSYQKRNNNFEKKFPMILKNITIHELGNFDFSISSDYPIGFRSSRLFSSILDPNKKINYESSTYLDESNQLKFRLKSEEEDIKENSPSECWNIILEKINGKKQNNLSGNNRFGFNHKIVKWLLEEMKKQ